MILPRRLSVSATANRTLLCIVTKRSFEPIGFRYTPYVHTDREKIIRYLTETDEKRLRRMLPERVESAEEAERLRKHAEEIYFARRERVAKGCWVHDPYDLAMAVICLVGGMSFVWLVAGSNPLNLREILEWEDIAGKTVALAWFAVGTVLVVAGLAAGRRAISRTVAIRRVHAAHRNMQRMEALKQRTADALNTEKELL